MDEITGHRHRRRRRRRPGRGRPGDRPLRPREVERVGSHHQGLEPDPDRGAQGGRVGHPRRALREGVPRPLPRGRHPPQHHGAPDADPRPADLAPEDHGQARHLREAPAAGRPHQDPPARRGALPRPRPARLERPDALRREGRHAAARQVEAAARHDAARLRPGAAAAIQGRDRPAVRHRPRHGADGLGQDEHALLGDRRPERPDRQHHDGRGPDRVQPRRASTRSR